MATESLNERTHLIFRASNHHQKIMLTQVILKEAREKAEAIGWQLESDMEHADDPVKTITTRARMKQLADLSRYIVSNSINEVYDETLNLDDTGLIAYDDFAELYPFVGRDVAEEEMKIGESQGTADCLEIIVPYKIASGLGARAIHYSYWKKNQLRKLYDFQENADGTAIATLPTRLPDVNIHYSYSPSSDYPERHVVFAKAAALHN